MGINKKIALLSLLALLHVHIIRMNEDLICYNDYNQTITCMFNSTRELTDTNCEIHAKKTNGK